MLQEMAHVWVSLIFDSETGAPLWGDSRRAQCFSIRETCKCAFSVFEVYYKWEGD